MLVKDPKKLRDAAKLEKREVGFWAVARSGTRIGVPLTVEKDDDKETILSVSVPLDRDLSVQILSHIGNFTEDGKIGANPEKSSGDYAVVAGDAKSREIRVTVQSLKPLKK